MIRTLNNATNISKNQQSPLILTEFTEYKKTTTCHVGNAVLTWDRHKNKNKKNNKQTLIYMQSNKVLTLKKTFRMQFFIGFYVIYYLAKRKYISKPSIE